MVVRLASMCSVVYTAYAMLSSVVYANEATWRNGGMLDPRTCPGTCSVRGEADYAKTDLGWYETASYHGVSSLANKSIRVTLSSSSMDQNGQVGCYIISRDVIPDINTVKPGLANLKALSYLKIESAASSTITIEAYCEPQIEGGYVYYLRNALESKWMHYRSDMDSGFWLCIAAEGEMSTKVSYGLMAEISWKFVDVTFDWDDGRGTTDVITYDVLKSRLGTLPVPESADCALVFAGWYTAAGGVGRKVLSSDPVPTIPTRYFAAWKKEGDLELDWTVAKAAIFEGFLLKSGGVEGVIKVKLGKTQTKTGESKVLATLEMTDGERIVFTGTTSTGSVVLDSPQGGRLSLLIGAREMTGDYGIYKITGGRTSGSVWQSLGMKRAFRGLAATVLLGADMASASGEGVEYAPGYSAVFLSVGATEKVKLIGRMADGAKFSKTVRPLVNDDGSFQVTVSVSKKGRGFGFLVTVDASTNVVVSNVSKWNSIAAPKASFSADWNEIKTSTVFSLPTVATFKMDVPSSPIVFHGGEVLKDLLPTSIAISFDKEKLKVKNGENLRLSNNKKSGELKGSFKLKYMLNGTQRSVSALLTGALVKDKGYGTVHVAGLGSFPFVIE